MGAKRPDREADRPSSSSTEVKNEWSLISALRMCLHDCGGKPLPLYVFRSKEKVFFFASPSGRAV